MPNAAHPKNCTTASHDEIRASERLWQGLSYVGVQSDGDGGLLELANCRCSSTLCREIRLLGEVA